MKIEEQKQKKKEYDKIYRQIPEVKVRKKRLNKIYSKEYYQKNKKRLNKKGREYYQKNKDKMKEYHKKYREKNKDNPKFKQKKKEYEQRAEVILRRKIYFQKNKGRWNKYYQQRKKIDKEFYLTCKLRFQLKSSLRKYSKTGKIMTSKKYGVDYKAIIEHLKPFPEDIRGYDIHHIKPLVKFNFLNEDGSTNLEEVRKSFAPENLILLTKEEHQKIHNSCS